MGVVYCGCVQWYFIWAHHVIVTCNIGHTYVVLCMPWWWWVKIHKMSIVELSQNKLATMSKSSGIIVALRFETFSFRIIFCSISLYTLYMCCFYLHCKHPCDKLQTGKRRNGEKKAIIKPKPSNESPFAIHQSTISDWTGYLMTSMSICSIYALCKYCAV